MEYSAKEKEFLSRPDTLTTMVDHVSNGGTLPGLADTLGVRASALFSWVREQKERADAMAEAYKARDEWAKEAVFDGLRDLSMFRIQDLYSGDGTLKPVEEWPQAAARAIAGIEKKELFDDEGNCIGTVTKAKLIERLKSLETTGKMLGVFVDKREISGELTLEQLVNAAQSDKPDKSQGNTPT